MNAPVYRENAYLGGDDLIEGDKGMGDNEACKGEISLTKLESRKYEKDSLRDKDDQLKMFGETQESFRVEEIKIWRKVMTMVFAGEMIQECFLNVLHSILPITHTSQSGTGHNASNDKEDEIA